MLGAATTVVEERLGHAFLEVVAARAGCQVIQPHTDYESVDGIIRPISGVPPVQIDVQIKASACLKRDSSTLKFPLKIKNYNDLRNTNVIMPRMLVVADLDADHEYWVKGNKEGMSLRRRPYWYDLRGQGATPNITTITINIPLSNVLSPESLVGLMGTGFENVKSGKGGLL